MDADGKLLVSGDLSVAAGTEVKVTDGTDDLEITAAGAAKVDGSATTQPVSGTVAVSNFPATQPVSGTVVANAGTGPFPVSDNSGSLTVDNNGTWSSIPDRPTQKSGRVYKEGVASAITADTTVYTVTATKTLYVTSMSFNVANSSTVNAGRLDIRDGTTVKITISAPAAGVGAVSASTEANHNSICFPEPKQFATDVNLDVVTGILLVSFEFTGYEE